MLSPGTAANTTDLESSAVAAVRAARHQPVACDAVDVEPLAICATWRRRRRRARRCARRRWGGRRQRRTRRPSRRPLRRGTTVRSGSLLVAHPIACLSQPTLHHAVILVLDVDDVSVMGVVVNKPLAPAAKPEGVALGEAVGDGQDGDREGVAKLGGLGASRIFGVATCGRTRHLLLRRRGAQRLGRRSSRRASTRAARDADASSSAPVVEARARQGVRRLRRLAPGPAGAGAARGVWVLALGGRRRRVARRSRSPLAAGQPAAALRGSARWSSRRRARRRARRAGRLQRRPRHAVDAPRGGVGGADRRSCGGTARARARRAEGANPLDQLDTGAFGEA